MLSVLCSAVLCCEDQFNNSETKRSKQRNPKMLAVFDKSVAKSPEGLQSPQSSSVSAIKDGFLAKHFTSVYPSSVTLNLVPSALLAYSIDKHNPLLPRYSNILHVTGSFVVVHIVSFCYFIPLTLMFFFSFHLGTFEEIKVGAFCFSG